MFLQLYRQLFSPPRITVSLSAFLSFRSLPLTKVRSQGRFSHRPIRASLVFTEQNTRLLLNVGESPTLTFILDVACIAETRCHMLYVANATTVHCSVHSRLRYSIEIVCSGQFRPKKQKLNEIFNFALNSI